MRQRLVLGLRYTPEKLMELPVQNPLPTPAGNKLPTELGDLDIYIYIYILDIGRVIRCPIDTRNQD